MRVGDAYFFPQHYIEDGPWVVDVIEYIHEDLYLFADRYVGGPSKPWRYYTRVHYNFYSLDGDYDVIPYEGMTPMSDLEKDAYHFAEMTKKEQELLEEFQWRDYVPPPGVADAGVDVAYGGLGVAYGDLGVFLGIGGIVVAFMMMQ